MIQLARTFFDDDQTGAASAPTANTGHCQLPDDKCKLFSGVTAIFPGNGHHRQRIPSFEKDGRSDGKA
jgi:hypothetical protein